MAKVCRKVRQSLFTKLALVLTVGIIAINAVTFSLYVNQKREHDTTLNRGLIIYARSLAEQVGSPPSKARAEALARQGPMRITLKGAQSWVVGETEKRFPERFLEPRFSIDGIEVLNIHENYRLRVPVDAHATLIFDLFPTQAQRFALKKFGWFSLAATCLVMFLIYCALRHYLRPIQWLTEGASAVRDGELDYRVREKGTGELRELTETFNQMSTRLETLVEGQRELLLGVSHELRTPLTRLKLRLEMLDTTADTAAICTNIRQMEAMITSLLDTAKMHREADGIRRRTTDLTRLITELAEAYREQAPGIIIDVPSYALTLDIDPDKITMALNMLLDNAMKYSKPDSPAVEITLRRQDQGITIVVRDYGIGIPEKSINHLFEPFYRVDESRTRETGGYGLGLHLCRSIVDAHGADIHVESTPDQGTVFRIVFPQ